VFENYGQQKLVTNSMTRELKTRLHATAHRRRKKIYRISRSESNGFCDSSKADRYSRRWPVKSPGWRAASAPPIKDQVH